MTARRATSKILQSLDSLLYKKKYKFKKGENPVFELDEGKRNKLSAKNKMDKTGPGVNVNVTSSDMFSKTMGYNHIDSNHNQNFKFPNYSSYYDESSATAEPL